MGSEWHWFVRFDLQILSGCVCHLEQFHAQSPFLFPIVFSINIYQSTCSPICQLENPLEIRNPPLLIKKKKRETKCVHEHVGLQPTISFFDRTMFFHSKSVLLLLLCVPTAIARMLPERTWREKSNISTCMYRVVLYLLETRVSADVKGKR